MGLTLGGSKSSGSQKSKSVTEATKKSTTEQTGVKTGTGSQATTEQQTVQALSAETQGILEKAIADIASGSVANENLSTFVQDLQARAAESEQTILAQTDAAIAEARRAGEQQIGRSITELAGATGSRQNSFVQQIALEAQTGLESQLAALGSEFAIKAREAQTAELTNVLAGLQSGVQSETAKAQSLAALGNILKGAETTATGTSATTTASTESQTISKLVDELIKSKTKTKGKTKSSGINIGFS